MDRQHIFVVHGSPFVLDLVRDILQAERYNVTTTNIVPRTFEQIAALEPDLLLVDLASGEGAGWDLLARLQTDAMTRGTPVIVFSNDPDLLERAKAIETPGGVRRFLEKPFHLTALLALVDELVGPA